MFEYSDKVQRLRARLDEFMRAEIYPAEAAYATQLDESRRNFPWHSPPIMEELKKKARAAGLSLTGVNARRFALGMAAPFVAGAAITYELWAVGNFTVMAPSWLLLYGAGVLTGGIFSVRVVRVIGVCFMAAGIGAILTPAEWGNVWLGFGFGGLQVGFGLYIARYHGG